MDHLALFWRFKQRGNGFRTKRLRETCALQAGQTQLHPSDTQTVKQMMETQTLLFKVQSSLQKVSSFAEPSLKKVVLRCRAHDLFFFEFAPWHKCIL